MVFDGITVAAVVKELNTRLLSGRITKIAQPEKEEILLTIKTDSSTERLFINASASMPSIHLTDENKPSPMTAPNFCMVLRKHLQGGRILKIVQPGLERVVKIHVEHLDEM
ncbi:MAG: NFACT family protein, partial [Lachnospiraceae bacterium]|nr:NFACT family protein [Lachnospiraceae bacterium]